jgi:hypothetical protein
VLAISFVRKYHALGLIEMAARHGQKKKSLVVLLLDQENGTERIFVYDMWRFK